MCLDPLGELYPIPPSHYKGAERGERVGKGEGGLDCIFVQGPRVPSYVTEYMYFLFFQGPVWYCSDDSSGAVVQCVGIQVICFSFVNGQTAAFSCLPLCISLWHFCTADCLLSIRLSL